MRYVFFQLSVERSATFPGKILTGQSERLEFSTERREISPPKSLFQEKKSQKFTYTDSMMVKPPGNAIEFELRAQKSFFLFYFKRVYEYRQFMIVLNVRKIKARKNGSFPDDHLRKPYPEIGKRGNKCLKFPVTFPSKMAKERNREFEGTFDRQ